MEPEDFAGRIGRWFWESEPWWPEPFAHPTVHPTS